MRGASDGSGRALAERSPAGVGRGAAGRWADLRIRVLSAAVLGPAGLMCVWYGGVAWAVLMLVAAAVLGWEWTGMCRRAGVTAWAPWLAMGTLVIAVALAVWGFEGFGLLVLLAGAGAAAWLGRGAALGLGVLYVGLPLVALAWLRGGVGVGRADMMFVVVVVWASDIGAYAAGRLLGGPRLAPDISPGKTWSGAFGGLLAAMVAGELAAQGLAPSPLGHAAVVAGLLGLASQAGDLLESWIKRRFGVKDSGRLIPGHGGLLDRVDGLLAAASAAACVAIVLGRGGILWH